MFSIIVVGEGTEIPNMTSITALTRVAHAGAPIIIIINYLAKQIYNGSFT